MTYEKNSYIKDIDGFSAYHSDFFANSGLMIPQGPPYAAQELLAEPAAASAPHGSSGQIWGQRKWSKQI